MIAATGGREGGSVGVSRAEGVIWEGFGALGRG